MNELETRLLKIARDLWENGRPADERETYKKRGCYWCDLGLGYVHIRADMEDSSGLVGNTVAVAFWPMRVSYVAPHRQRSATYTLDELEEALSAMPRVPPSERHLVEAWCALLRAQQSADELLTLARTELQANSCDNILKSLGYTQ